MVSFHVTANLSSESLSGGLVAIGWLPVGAQLTRANCSKNPPHPTDLLPKTVEFHRSMETRPRSLRLVCGTTQITFQRQPGKSIPTSSAPDLCRAGLIRSINSTSGIVSGTSANNNARRLDTANLTFAACLPDEASHFPVISCFIFVQLGLLDLSTFWDYMMPASTSRCDNDSSDSIHFLLPQGVGDTEDVERYKRGGFHPVHVGDQYDDGRYKISHKLGAGGFANIWFTEDLVEHQWAALKIFLVDESPSIETRILLSHDVASRCSC